MMVFLATPDPWTIGIGVLNTAIGAAITFLFFRLSAAQRATDRKEDARIADMKAMAIKLENTEKSTHELAAKLVDERFRAMSHSVGNHVQGLVTTIDEMKERLKLGDGDFANLREGDHKLEIELLKSLADHREYVSSHAASKDDLAAHQKRTDASIETILERLGKQDRQMAVIAHCVGAKKVE